MGGGISSSNDNYVLHYLPDEEDRTTALLSIDNNNSSSPTKSFARSQSSNKIDMLDKKLQGYDNLGESGNPIVKLRSRSNSTTAAPMKSQKSILVSQKSIVMTTQSKTNCSEKFPWLIKNTKFTASSLSDFEFGRIIG